MDVSVIIVNYNTCDLLRSCLKSLGEMTVGVKYEIIVVDNASADSSCLMLKEEFPEVKLIESDINLGFGKANNLGSDAAKGKYLFYLNSDTLLLNNALKMFFDYSESNGCDIVTGSILKGRDMKPCHSYGRFITPGNELRSTLAKYLRFLKRSELLHPHEVDMPQDVDYITGAALWVPRGIYESTGGFDPAFFMYCEEVDWQKRMSDIGIKRRIIPGPQIVHLEGGSDSGVSRHWSVTRLGNLYKSTRIYMKKHFPNIYIPFRLLYLILNTPSVLMLGMADRKYLKLLALQ